MMHKGNRAGQARLYAQCSLGVEGSPCAAMLWTALPRASRMPRGWQCTCNPLAFALKSWGMHKGPCMRSASAKCSHGKSILDQGRKLAVRMQRQHGRTKLSLHTHSCSETVQAVLQSACLIIKAKQTHTRPVETCHGSSPVKWPWKSLPAHRGHVPLFLMTALQLPPPV